LKSRSIYSNSSGKGWLQKVYSKREAVNFEQTSSRFEVLNSYKHQVHPQLELDEDDECWIVKQRFTSNAKKFLFFSNEQLKKIARKLDEFAKVDLFHGDLCFSNISFDSDGDALFFDWEVSLEVTGKKGIVLRTSPYCLHPDDKEFNRISKKTDLFGLAAITLISCHHPSWRSGLSFDDKKRLILANYLEVSYTSSYSDLIENMTRSILRRRTVLSPDRQAVPRRVFTPHS